MKTQSLQRKSKPFWIYIVLFLAALLQFFPMVWLFDFSLCKDSELFTSSILKIPNEVQWVNYERAWVDGKMPLYMKNSIIVCGATIILVILFSMMLSYAFARIEWKGRGLVFTIILLGMMIPIQATLVPNFLVFKALNLTDSYLGLIIPYTAFSLPMAVFIMTGFMKSVPRSLEESAIIDGCGIYRIIFLIDLPLVKPAIVTITVITFLNNWNEFIMAFTYTSKTALRTLPFSVYEFAGLYSASYATQFAVMLLSSLPTLLVYVFLNEQITKGVTMGALK